MNFKIENRQDKENELRMLNGNIARIAISKDKEEIETMKEFAKARIDAISDYSISQLK